MNWLDMNFWHDHPKMMDISLDKMDLILKNFKKIQKFVFKDHPNMTSDDFKYVIKYKIKDFYSNPAKVYYRNAKDGENFWARISGRKHPKKGYKISYYNDSNAINDGWRIQWENEIPPIKVEYFPTKEETIEKAKEWCLQHSEKAKPPENGISWNTYSFWKKREGLLQEQIDDFNFYLSSLKTIKKYISEMM